MTTPNEQQQPRRILVIEDVPEIVLGLKIRLQAAGYGVLTAGDGSKGLEMAREQRPDLIILDLMLPKVHGYKVCRLLKFDKEYERIPIIMLTARAMSHEKDLGMEVGADAYFTKPYDHKELLQAIEEFLSGRRPVRTFSDEVPDER
jgi:two-component system alkaline phosphatase synthesis response regulator PhoP